MGMLAAVNAPSGGGDIDDVIHMSSKDEDHVDEEDSILAAVEKAATRKGGCEPASGGKPASQAEIWISGAAESVG